MPVAPFKERSMKKLIVVVLLALLLIPMVVIAASDIEIIDKTGDGYWDGNTWYVELYPGETARATLRLRNNTEEAIKVELKKGSKTRYENISLWWNNNRLNLEGYQTREALLYAKVKNTAPPGQYQAEFTVEWEEGKVEPIYTWPPKLPEDSSDPLLPIYYPPPKPSEPVPDNRLGLWGWICIGIVGASLITAIVCLERQR